MHLCPVNTNAKAAQTARREVHPLPIALPTTRLSDKTRVGAAFGVASDEPCPEGRSRLLVRRKRQHDITAQVYTCLFERLRRVYHRCDGGFHIAGAQPVDPVVPDRGVEGIRHPEVARIADGFGVDVAAQDQAPPAPGTSNAEDEVGTLCVERDDVAIAERLGGEAVA